MGGAKHYTDEADEGVGHSPGREERTDESCREIRRAETPSRVKVKTNFN